MAVLEVLVGHISPETAHITHDYPYGFRLRCQRREWLEYKPKKGYRFVTQTSNPKRAGLVWNTPKASVYVTLAVLYLDEADHVQWDTLHIYATEADIDAFAAQYGPGLEEECERTILAFLRAVAQECEARKAKAVSTASASTL